MKIRVKKVVKEISTAAAVVGFPVANRRKRKSNSQNLEEMFSSSTQTGGVRISIVSGEDEHAGHVEKSQHQGLRNVMKEVEDTIDLDDFNTDDQIMATDSDEDVEPEERMTQVQILYPEIYKELFSRGFKLFKVLGRGHFGAVFSAEDLETGGDYVIKAVGLGNANKVGDAAVDRELSNYATVSAAAGTDVRMWRHFPEVYDTFKVTISEQDFTDDIGFIVMEKLVPLTSDESAFIPDVNFVVARKKPMDAADVNDYAIGRDQSIKAKNFINSGMPNVERYIIDAFRDITGEFDVFGKGDKEVDDLGARLNPRVLKRYHTMASQDAEKLDQIKMNLEQQMLQTRGYDMANYYYILAEEVEEAPEAIVVLLDMMITLVKLGKLMLDRDENTEGVIRSLTRSSIQKVATAFINGIRKNTSIPMGFSQYNIGGEWSGSPGRDLTTAIQLLHKKTGLFAKDIHDQNVMKREGGGDIVIVDLGLFRMDPKFKEEVNDLSESITKDRAYRIKILTKGKKSYII